MGLGGGQVGTLRLVGTWAGVEGACIPHLTTLEELESNKTNFKILVMMCSFSQFVVTHPSLGKVTFKKY